MYCLDCWGGKEPEKKKGALIKGHQIWLLVVVKGQKTLNVWPFKELAPCLVRVAENVVSINTDKIK